MNRIRIAASTAALLGLHAAVAAAAQPVVFEGSIWSNGGVGLQFEEHVAPGQMRSMRLTGGQTVEMSVDTTGQPLVRLLDRSGQVLHSIASPAGTASTTFMYALCRKGGIAYSSPPDRSRSGCP